MSYSGSFVISLSSCMLQRLSTVTLHFPAFLPEFSSSLQRHDIQQVAVSLMCGANPKFVVTPHLPPIFYSVCMTSNYTIWVHYHGKTQENSPSTRCICQCQLKGLSSPSRYDSLQPSSFAAAEGTSSSSLFDSGPKG
jgi:hypothetical protein